MTVKFLFSSSFFLSRQILCFLFSFFFFFFPSLYLFVPTFSNCLF